MSATEAVKTAAIRKALVSAKEALKNSRPFNDYSVVGHNRNIEAMNALDKAINLMGGKDD